MKKLISITMILCFSVILLSFPSKSFACSCIQPSEPNEALGQANAVFKGKVIDIIEEQPTIFDKVTPLPDFPEKYVTMEVTYFWKGVTEKTVVVRTDLGGGIVGFLL